MSFKPKPYLKQLLYRLRMAEWLDGFNYRSQSAINKTKNRLYLQQNPDTVLPDDYVLYETYQLNYRKFIEDGKLASKEIYGWTKNHIPEISPRILDWGCGAARVTRHLPGLQPNALLYGCDTNEALTEWNKIHFSGITFSTINHFTPTMYADSFFDLVYGFSVFTHIDAAKQEEWVEELFRILKQNGILLITTHGSKYAEQLLPNEKRELKREGIFTKRFAKQGHRMMTSYQLSTHFKKILDPLFTIIEYYDGSDHPDKAGGQDVWILRKRTDEQMNIE